MRPILYLYFHAKILDWKGKEMSNKEFKSCLFQWRIPKNLREPIMKEMEKIGLISFDKRLVKLNDFYFEQPKKKANFKDDDTRIKSPYFFYNKL